MGRIVGKAQYRDILLGAGLLWATLALVLWPEQAMEAMRDGLKLCGNVILPSLFPFFVLSSLVVELGMSRYLGRLLEPVMAPLFRVNGSCAAALPWALWEATLWGPEPPSRSMKMASAPGPRRNVCWPSATTAARLLFWV